MTTLSVLVPHMNDPRGFELSLRSVEAQTWKGDREVLVVDDGSTASAFQKLCEIAEASSERVRVLQNPENRGRPFTRNALLDAADGKYSAWLDAGDEWYPEKLQQQFDALYRTWTKNTKQPVWCTTNYDWQWEGGRKRPREQAVDGNQVSNLLTGKLAAYLWTLLGTTQSFRDVGRFDLRLTRLQDLDFFLRFTEKGGRLVLPDDQAPLCVYHKSDIGRRGEEVLACFEYIYEKHAAVLMRYSRKFRRNRRFEMYYHVARFAKNNDDVPRTAGYLAAAAAHNPFIFAKRMVKNRGKL